MIYNLRWRELDFFLMIDQVLREVYIFSPHYQSAVVLCEHDFFLTINQL